MPAFEKLGHQAITSILDQVEVVWALVVVNEPTAWPKIRELLESGRLQQVKTLGQRNAFDPALVARVAGVAHLVELARQDLVELVDREPDAVVGEALIGAGSAPADAVSTPSDVGSAPVDAGSARADAADSAAVEEVVLPESPLGLAALIEAAVVKLAAAPLGLVSDADVLATVETVEAARRQVKIMGGAAR